MRTDQMKKFWFILIVTLWFPLSSFAHPHTKGKTNVLPQPLQESSGQIIYEEMGCAMCHGYQGGGDGFMADGLSPRPRDFTSFEQMSRISDMSMYHSIRNGIPGTAMPSWELSDEQIFDVISYIKTFLADSQMTMTVCFNEQRKVDLNNLYLEGKPQITVDRAQYVNVAAAGDQVIIQPQDKNVLGYFRKTRRKLMRTHVSIKGKGEEAKTALIAVRIRDCYK